MAKSIFHIDLDAFFASVHQVLDPQLRARPVIVKGPGEHRTVVAAGSYEARAYGIKAGMAVAKARRLCPGGAFVSGRAEVYADISQRAFEVCSEFSPLTEPASIDEWYLDMTGTERLYGYQEADTYWPIQVAEMVKLTIRDRLGLNCSIGIGTNKLIAKIASGYAKPNGIAYVWPGHERRFLKPLPVEAIPGIGTKSLACLQTLGVKTVGQMQELPVNVLTGIFGVIGEDFFYLANGLGSDTIDKPIDPKSVSRGTTFDRDTCNVEFVKHTLRRLIADVSTHLRKLGFWANLVTVRIRYGDFTTVSRQGLLENFTHYDHEICDLAYRLFDRLYRRGRSIRHVAVGVGILTDHAVRQIGLWENTGFDRDKSIYNAIDAIRSKFGENSIFFAKDFEPTRTVKTPRT